MSQLFENDTITSYQARTLAILDKAEELLLRFGYSKVTMDDIAAAANLGKGTIYLHWKSKESLFYALLSKASAEVVCDLLKILEDDSDAVFLDNLIAALFTACIDRPIIVALFTKETKLLGKLLNSEFSTKSQAAKSDSLRKGLEVYRKHGLVRLDIPVEAQMHSINLLITGIFNYNSYLSQPLAKRDLAALLKTIVRSSLLPGSPPPAAPPPQLPESQLSEQPLSQAPEQLPQSRRPASQRPEPQGTVNNEVYKHICNEFRGFLELYKSQVLASTIK